MVYVLLVIAVCTCKTVSAQTTEQVPTDDTRLLNCHIDAESSEECDATAYAYRVVYYTLPGMIVGVLMFLICPFFLCCHCCGCCGCGSIVPRSSWDVVRGKLYALVLCVLVFCLSGLYGNISAGQLRSSLLGIADTTDGVPDRIGAELEAIETALTVEKYSAANDSYYEDNLFAGSSLATEGNKTRQNLENSMEGGLDDFRAAVNQFDFVLFILFSLPCAVAGAGLLAALCNVRNCLPMLVAAMFFVGGFLLWTLFGLFSGVGLVIEDACAEVQGVVDQQQTVLIPLTGCKNSQFTSFTESFEQIERDVSLAVCETVQGQCFQEFNSLQGNLNAGRTYDCGSGVTCVQPRFADVVAILDRVFIHQRVKESTGAVADGNTCRDTTLNCTYPECGEGCRLDSGERSERGRLSLQLFSEFQAAESVSLALETLGGRYGSCTAMYGVILGTFSSTCEDLVTAGSNVRNAYGVTAMLSVFAIVVMTMGATRFMSFDEAAESRKPKDEGTAQEQPPQPSEAWGPEKKYAPDAASSPEPSGQV